MSVGVHVRGRREQQGVSMEQLAAATGLAVDRISAIEGGPQGPTINELTAIAECLDIDPGQLFRGEIAVPPQRSRARFLAPSGVSKLASEDLRLLARAAEVGRTCWFLQRLLGMSDSPIRQARQVRGVKDRPTPWKQGYDLAARAREIFDASGKALPSMQGLLESNFVHVATVEFSSRDILAASLLETEAAPVILLNKLADRVRSPLLRRAVLAHELCHLLHDGGERDLVTTISRADERDPVESRANGFAPAFIAPEKWVVAAEGEPLEVVVDLAQRWGLGFEAAAWHASNLELITPTQAENLVAQGSNVRIETHVEPPLPRTDPTSLGVDVSASAITRGLLSELALRAHAEHLISAGRVAEILSLR